jgi:hypothetical protein
MLKRLSIALLGLFVLVVPSFGAGTIPLSLSQQFDKFGHVLAGCKLNIFQAGTVGTPQTAYQDSALTIPVPGGSQLTCDAAGRLPQFFLADGSVKILLTDKNGVTQVTADGIVVVGASSGGGGGSPVDPTTILTTGDIKATYGTGVVTGFVRLNGRTIGSATSGASERANSDCQALFQYLWGADPNLVVPSGRGASANADWIANKQLTLPDFRSRALAGLGDMGNSDNALFAGVTFTSGTSTTLGSLLGAAQRTLTLAQLPTGITSNNPAQSISVTSSSSVPQNPTYAAVAQTGFDFGFSGQPATGVLGSSGNNNITVTSNNTSGSAFDSVSPYGLITIYVKL